LVGSQETLEESDRARHSWQTDFMSSIRDPPHVRLHLRNGPENVALVRTVLAGVAEAIDIPREDLDDIRTAVSEACNNVVLHAYRGGPGPLEVDVRIDKRALEVVVRDEGIGIQDQGDPVVGEALGISAIDEESLKLGLPVIQALADHTHFHKRVNGGTEVQMEFATPGVPLLETSDSDDLTPLPVKQSLVELLTVEQPELVTAATIAVAPTRLARTVLPRLVCALAARANFSTDRLSDAQFLADLIAAQSFQSIIGSHLGVGIAVQPRRVELRIGLLPAVEANRVPADLVLGALSPVVKTLTDDQSLMPVGSASVLALQLIDRRRAATGDE
jgi:serine/threonine-protein kinase RsbW